MCTAVSFLKKACIQRRLNREMISATILSGHNRNDVIDVGYIDANILRGPRSLKKSDHGLLKQDDNTSYSHRLDYVFWCRRHSGRIKTQIYRLNEFIINKPHPKRVLLIT